ncbi:unnamed protein product, partial [Prorocentrum cordatum]
VLAVDAHLTGTCLGHLAGHIGDEHSGLSVALPMGSIDPSSTGDLPGPKIGALIANKNTDRQTRCTSLLESGVALDFDNPE